MAEVMTNPCGMIEKTGKSCLKESSSRREIWEVMVENRKAVKGIGLCSGGLDSILSGLVLRKQGIDVTWLTFETPFFSADKARKASRMTGIPLIVRDITEIYLEMLKNPPLGYGKHMNPCRDCHALMFRLAGEMMESRGYDFLFSGEVAGQRPLSQTKQSLRYVEKSSGFDGHILRPLSAKILPETEVEKRGLVKRELLCEISGRSRKEQIRMAEEFGVTDYPAPAGGCLLTDKGYSKRLKDLFDHQEVHPRADLSLLKFGRHIRLSDTVKIIVGRTRGDNDSIRRYLDPARHLLLDVRGIPSPVALVPVEAGPEEIRLAASLCAGYTKLAVGESADVVVQKGASRELLRVKVISPKDHKEKVL